jgi:hypothetical protein
MKILLFFWKLVSHRSFFFKHLIHLISTRMICNFLLRLDYICPASHPRKFDHLSSDPGVAPNSYIA